jgi:hypothetical protein
MTFATDTAECSNKSDEYDARVVLLVIVCLCFELFNQALTIDLFTRETWEFELRSFDPTLCWTPLKSDKTQPKIDSFDHLETWKLGSK